MILDAKITGQNIELLNVRQAMKKPQEKVLIQAFDRSTGAFLSRLALFEGKGHSEDMILLQNVGKEFLQVVSEDPNVGIDRLGSILPYLHPLRAEEIGEKLDDEIHSPFLYSGHLQNIYGDFVYDIEHYARRSKSKTLLKLLREQNKTIISRQLYFFLADNPDNDEYPFVFMALIPVQKDGKQTWISLKQLKGRGREARIIKETLDYRLFGAAKESPFLKRMITSHLILHPVLLTDEEAFDMVQDIEIYERHNLFTMLPAWMKDSRTKLSFSWKESSGLINEGTLSAYVPEMVYHGEMISEEEAEQLLQQAEGMIRLNGRWIKADHKQLNSLLNQFRKLRENKDSLMELLRMEAEFEGQEDIPELDITYEDWIASRFGLNREVVPSDLSPAFKPVLRPYQKQAFAWLDKLSQHQLGAVLADDMGLGKTVEVLSLLEAMRQNGKNKILIVVPATLVGNWLAEIRKFAPWMSVTVLDTKNTPEDGKTGAQISLITYQKCLKSKYVETVDWDALILDEAQAIKNPLAGQTKKVKQLKAGFKLALTGTPIENNLTELWSIFDFINPGLLGSKDEFSILKGSGPEDLERLKRVIAPFVMRRMKTDKSVISDLPEKNEIEVTINLSKEQIVLYRDQVKKLEQAMEEVEPHKRKFLILAAITRLKQICNHPAQFLKSGDYKLSRSGKFEELKNIAETIHENGETMIVFTQFAQIIPALDHLLEGVFKKKGAAIDGSTPVKKRMGIVDAFQNHELPYLVLSLKAAGVGLNLTEAHTVVHFDRWWNPAVENQATDRAYRIGQRNDVTVYKFLAANTIEEVISSMLKQKQELADQVINDLDSETLSQLSADDLMRAIRWRG